MDKENRVKILNSLSLTIENEDHTIMNPLKYVVQSDFNQEGVELCGYTIPHPSEPTVNFTVQMKDEKKQTLENLLGVTSRGIDNLILIVDKTMENVNKEIG